MVVRCRAARPGHKKIGKIQDKRKPEGRPCSVEMLRRLSVGVLVDSKVYRKQERLHEVHIAEE